MDADDESKDGEAALHDVIQNVGQVVEDFVFVCSRDAINSKLLVDLRDQLDRNMHELSGVPYTEEHKGSNELILPHEHKGHSGEVVSDYLKHTPLRGIFDSRVPFSPPKEARFEHSWLCAGTGHGKTNALATMIARDLEAVAAGQCWIVILDSQNQLIQKLQGSNCTAR